MATICDHEIPFPIMVYKQFEAFYCDTDNIRCILLLHILTKSILLPGTNHINMAMECENYLTDELKPEKSLPCFDCSICLDFAKDPVVTLCGHLYCWPCIYKWLSFPTDSGDNPPCPVCKSEISDTSVVPLYGRGKTFSDNEPGGKTPNNTAVIPPRPHAALLSPANSARQPPYESQSDGLDAYNPNVWMYGEMIYARVFGNSQSLYTFPNSYHLAGSNSPRLRRQEMQVDRSLNRLTLFLFCCFFVCLLLF